MREGGSPCPLWSETFQPGSKSQSGEGRKDRAPFAPADDTARSHSVDTETVLLGRRRPPERRTKGVRDERNDAIDDGTTARGGAIPFPCGEADLPQFGLSPSCLPA